MVAFADRIAADVFVADIDVMTAQGGLSLGAEVTTSNDIILANLYAMLIGLARHKVTDPCR